MDTIERKQPNSTSRLHQSISDGRWLENQSWCRYSSIKNIFGRLSWPRPSQRRRTVRPIRAEFVFTISCNFCDEGSGVSYSIAMMESSKVTGFVYSFRSPTFDTNSSDESSILRAKSSSHAIPLQIQANRQRRGRSLYRPYPNKYPLSRLVWSSWTSDQSISML